LNAAFSAIVSSSAQNFNVQKQVLSSAKTNDPYEGDQSCNRPSSSTADKRSTATNHADNRSAQLGPGKYTLESNFITKRLSKTNTGSVDNPAGGNHFEHLDIPPTSGCSNVVLTYLSIGSKVGGNQYILRTMLTKFSPSSRCR